MIRPLIITFASIFISISAFGQYNYRQKLGSMATIAMPDTPKVKNNKGIDIYFVNFQNVFYLAQASELKSGLKDLFAKNSTDSLYNSYIKGTLGGTKGTLFYKHNLRINNHNGIEFGYRALLNNQQTYRYHRAVYLSDTILMCGIWAADSLSKDDPALLSFFKGFQVKSAAEINEATSYNNAFKMGRATGYILGIIIMACVGLGVVFILQRLIYGKKKSINPNTGFENINKH